jgi:hypothetical protein
MTSPHDAERLREVFTDAAYGITPSPVPLAAIEKTAHARRRRRTAILTAACGLLLIPLAGTAVHFATPSPTPRNTVWPAATVPSVRVVTPGERVQAAPGVRVWLAGDGKHWSTPEFADQFSSVTDGNLARPGVSAQTETVRGGTFLSGVYTGTGSPATVKVVTRAGTFTARVIHLAGQSWGAWYVPKELPFAAGGADAHRSFVRSVTVYDTAGRTITAWAAAR